MAFRNRKSTGKVARTAPAKRRNGRAARGPLAKKLGGQMRVTQRGMALILVITSIAILTTVAVDFQYNSSVDLQLAANARDELRAEYLARSSINMSRLLLRFQKQLDAMGGGFDPSALIKQFAPDLLPPGAEGLAPPGGGGLNIRLWEIVPIDCSVMGMLTAMSGGSSFEEAQETSGPEFGEGAEFDLESGLPAGLPGAKRSFGDFEGCFTAEIGDEEQKINLNRLNHTGMTGMVALQHAMALVADRRFDFLYEQPDANDVKMNATDMLIAFHDWIDDRDTQASINPPGASTGVDPFPDGFGDENRNYTGYPNRYRSKNAAFDTLDELYQVDGVSDLWMAAFRDRVTVYPDKNRAVNINTNDPIQQIANIQMLAANPLDPKLQNPVVIETILKEIAWFKMVSFTGMNPMTFANIVERNGIVLRSDIKNGGKAALDRYFTDKSETFTIKATGTAGKVTKTITAVVRANNALGKLLYYREE